MSQDIYYDHILLPCTISVLSVVNDYSPPLHSLSGPVAKSFHTFRQSCKMPPSPRVHAVTWAKLSHSFSGLLLLFCLGWVLRPFLRTMSLLEPSGLLQYELWRSELELAEQPSSWEFLSPLPWIESLFCESLSWFTSLFWLSITSWVRVHYRSHFETLLREEVLVENNHLLRILKALLHCV